MADGMDNTGQVDKEARLAYYLAMLADESPTHRWNAAISLGRLGDPRGVEPLITALDDEDDRVRLKVIWALGAIGDARATGPLRARYRIENDDIQEIIRESLESIQQNSNHR